MDEADWPPRVENVTAELARQKKILSDLMAAIREVRRASLQSMETEVMTFCESKGWPVSQEDIGLPEAVALLHSEISEILEAWRSHGLADVTNAGAGAKPEGVGSEFADVLIRLLHYASVFCVDLEREFTRKMAYNQTRSFRHGGKRG